MPGDRLRRFSELQHALNALTDTLTSHLACEEREMVEPVARDVASALLPSAN